MRIKKYLESLLEDKPAEKVVVEVKVEDMDTVKKPIKTLEEHNDNDRKLNVLLRLIGEEIDKDKLIYKARKFHGIGRGFMKRGLEELQKRGYITMEGETIKKVKVVEK